VSGVVQLEPDRFARVGDVMRLEVWAWDRAIDQPARRAGFSFSAIFPALSAFFRHRVLVELIDSVPSVKELD
jgi:hypothetical protein